MNHSKTKYLACVLLYPIFFWSAWHSWKEIESIRQAPCSVTSGTISVPKGEKLDAPVATEATPPLVEKKQLDARNLSAEERAELAKELAKAPKREGYRSLSFSFLSGFECGDVGAGTTPVIPARILDLDTLKVGVTGFMVPMELNEDKTTRFILLRNQLLCCYGEEPKVNEWVYVAFEDPVAVVSDQPIAVFGMLESSPDIVDGQLISLYRMNGHALSVLD